MATDPNPPPPTARITGDVYLTSRHRSDMDCLGFGHLSVQVGAIKMVTDAAGWYSPGSAAAVTAGLSGSFAAVTNRRESSQLSHNGAPAFHWQTALAGFPGDRVLRECMAYYHVTNARAALERTSRNWRSIISARPIGFAP